MNKTTLYLTRHGETEWNVAKRMQGHQDSPLTEKGIGQARSLGLSLDSIDFNMIYSSTSPRALKTAELIRNQKKTEIVHSDHLREISLGNWEGQHNIEQLYPEEHYAFWKTPHIYVPKNGGESFDDVQKRAFPFIQDIITKHKGEKVLIVTHSVTLKLIMSYFENRSLEKLWEPPFLHPTSLSKVVFEQTIPTIEFYADTSHFIA